MSEESLSVRLFARALEVPAADRDAFLVEQCPDESLRAELRSLLEHHEAAPGFLEHAPGAAIGPYRIVRTLGEGGFGVVYLAEQERPIRRRVALKVIKAGMDTAQTIARFALERQALAMMEHPGIARVFDAGATPRGRPYVAMEHVEGVPITAYCSSHRLSVRQRLDLFIPVCDAVQHAHQKGIIHRDLKPSNILVTEPGGDATPVGKVIDFGIAKATDHRERGLTMETQPGLVLATPEYASPEQVDPALGDIDTRTDIYSLGCVLYELLTGSPPLDRESVRRSSLAEIQRRIREEPPVRPSTRALSAGDAALSRQLRGDLDWILARAMEKDRERRYASAAELGADLRRHLRREPVLAGPPSTTYRLRRFASRHRGALAAAGAIFTALIVGLAFAIAGLVEARRQTKEARAQAGNSEAVLSFLTNDMIGAVDPSRTRGAEVTAKELFAAARDRVGERFPGRPIPEGAARFAIGEMQRRLGDLAGAREQLERSLALRRGALGERHEDTLKTMTSLAWVEDDLGDFPRAHEHFRFVLDERRRTLGADDARTVAALSDVALVLAREATATPAPGQTETPQRREEKARELDESERLHREVLGARERLLGPAHPDTLLTANNLAWLLLKRDRPDEAAPLVERAHAGAVRASGDDDRMSMLYANTLGLVLAARQRFDEAERVHTANLARRRRVLGESHPDTLASMSNLARVYAAQGRRDEAITLWDQVVETRRARQKPGEPDDRDLTAAIKERDDLIASH